MKRAARIDHRSTVRFIFQSSSDNARIKSLDSSLRSAIVRRSCSGHETNQILVRPPLTPSHPVSAARVVRKLKRNPPVVNEKP